MSPPIQLRKPVFLNKVDVDWFEEHYAGATLSWALSMLLEKFRLAHDSSPRDYAEAGAKALKEEIDDAS